MFLFKEINSALQLSFGVGIPVGIMGAAIYYSVCKSKKEGKSVSAFINDDESNVTELLDSMRKACPENKLSAFEEESRKIRTKFAQEPKKVNAGFFKIEWKDYLNNALGFSVVFFCSLHILYRFF